MLPVVAFLDHSATGDMDCHSATGSGCAEGTDHDSIDWVVPEPLLEALPRIGA